MPHGGGVTNVHRGPGATLNTSADRLPFLPVGATPHCREYPRVFQRAGDTGAPDAIAEARDVCEGCPFLDACARYAITTGESWGVWGGTTAEERQRIRASLGGQPLMVAGWA